MPDVGVEQPTAVRPDNDPFGVDVDPVEDVSGFVFTADFQSSLDGSLKSSVIGTKSPALTPERATGSGNSPGSLHRTESERGCRRAFSDGSGRNRSVFTFLPVSDVDGLRGRFDEEFITVDGLLQQIAEPVAGEDDLPVFASVTGGEEILSVIGSSIRSIRRQGEFEVVIQGRRPNEVTPSVREMARLQAIASEFFNATFRRSGMNGLKGAVGIFDFILCLSQGVGCGDPYVRMKSVEVVSEESGPAVVVGFPDEIVATSSDADVVHRVSGPQVVVLHDLENFPTELGQAAVQIESLISGSSEVIRLMRLDGTGSTVGIPRTSLG